jgi:hypothetical protein
MPSSIVDVQTMAVFWPLANCSSASVRSARLTELWWMKTSTPVPASACATFSALLRLSTNTRLFFPRAICPIAIAASLMSAHISRRRSRCALGFGGSTRRNGRALEPCSHSPIT